MRGDLEDTHDDSLSEECTSPVSAHTPHPVVTAALCDNHSQPPRGRQAHRNSLGLQDRAPSWDMPSDENSSDTERRGSHPLVCRRVSEPILFGGDPVTCFDRAPSQSLPIGSSGADPLLLPPPQAQRGPPPPVASSLPTTSALTKRFGHLKLVPLADFRKPLDPVGEATPSTPAAPPPVAEKPKGAWRPRKKMQGVVMAEQKPLYLVWYTAHNMRFAGYGDYSSATRKHRQGIEVRARKWWDAEGEGHRVRAIGFSASLANAIRPSPEEAAMQLRAALRGQVFELPPTEDSLASEGFTPLEEEEIKLTFWYSKHLPIRRVGVGSLYKCTYLGTAPVRHYFMKVCPKSSLGDEEWEALFLEVQVLKLLGHPCCGSFVRSFHSKDAVHTVVGAFVEQVDLLTWVQGQSGRLEVRSAQSVVKDLAGVLGYLHTQVKVAYGGVRGVDMMVTGEGKLLLLDFTRVRCLVATDAPICAAFRRAPRRRVCPDASKADIANVGCVLHLLLHGTLPVSHISGGASDALPLPLNDVLEGSPTAAELLAQDWFGSAPTGRVAWTPPEGWQTKVKHDFDKLVDILFP